MPHEQFKSCIDACVRCAQECEHCATACLGERDAASLANCIRLDADCAEMCWGVASFMSRGSEFAPDLCGMCAEICDVCAAECQKHASRMDHCRVCAEVCRNCAEECRQVAGVTA